MTGAQYGGRMDHGQRAAGALDQARDAVDRREWDEAQAYAAISTAESSLAAYLAARGWSTSGELYPAPGWSPPDGLR